MINCTKPYRLTATQKEAIALHLAGVTSAPELAKKLRLEKSQYVPQAIYALVRHRVRTKWPAAGFVDTEIRCLTELASGNATKEVQPRVQA